MNPNTGAIYRTQEEIEAAVKRGEPLVPVNDVFKEAKEQVERLNREMRRREIHKSGGSHAQRRPLHAGKRR